MKSIRVALRLYRELDDTPGLTDSSANTLADARTGKNGRHRLAGLLRESVFGRLGYEDLNNAERLCRDYTLAHMEQRMTASWDRPIESGSRGRSQSSSHPATAVCRSLS